MRDDVGDGGVKTNGIKRMKTLHFNKYYQINSLWFAILTSSASAVAP